MQSSTPSSSLGDCQSQSSRSRWLALTHRTPSAHSSFFYGVRSTMVYCRPTCTARLARRANVVYYDTEDQARHDGYRPCKRCRPDDSTFVGEKEEVVSRAVALLRTRQAGSIMKRGLKELAKEVGVTPSYLCRVFKQVMGVTIGEYMVRFDEEASESESQNSTVPLQVLDAGSTAAVVSEHPRPAAQATIMLNHSLAGCCEEGLAENSEEKFAQALDLNFDFDQWFWAGDFSNEEFSNDWSIHGVL